MTISNTEEEILKLLAESELFDVSVNPVASNLHLAFSSIEHKIKIQLELYKVIHVSFSRDQNEIIPYSIDEVILNFVKDIDPIFVSYTVAYQARYEYAKTISIPKNGLYHLHVDGDVIIDAVAESYQIKSESF